MKQIKLFFKHIDLRDIFILFGLTIMCTGLWMLRPWISLTICGGFILYQALMAESRK